MIGFYNYTVILTYMSLISAITGMTFAHAGVFGAAIFCLALSGFFDMFDGKVARRKKDRTDDEKLFGIQLDSLSACFRHTCATAWEFRADWDFWQSFSMRFAV